MAIRISTPVVNILRERGLLPDHCRNIELTIPPAGAMVLTFEVYVTDDHLEILGEAFLAEAARVRQETVGHKKAGVNA